MSDRIYIFGPLLRNAKINIQLYWKTCDLRLISTYTAPCTLSLMYMAAAMTAIAVEKTNYDEEKSIERNKKIKCVVEQCI